MTGLPLVELGTTDSTAQELFTTARQQLGGVPNMVRAMANSPALLRGYLQLHASVSRGRLRPDVREKIALAIAQRNQCDYCMSAHTLVAESVLHLDTSTIEAARQARSDDPKVDATLRLAVEINDARGGVRSQQLDLAREAGLDDSEIAEIVGNVALNALTNYFNRAADVEVDFPLVRTAGLEASPAALDVCLRG